MKTGVFAGGACRFTRSIPGRNHQAPGTGGEDTTGTVFPIGSSASASASAEPSVSPSASLWVTAVTTRALSITCQIRGASSATSGRGGASSATGVGLPLLDLAQKLADPDAVGHALIELEMQVRCEAQVREPGAKLAPDDLWHDGTGRGYIKRWELQKALGHEITLKECWAADAKLDARRRYQRVYRRRGRKGNQ